MGLEEADLQRPRADDGVKDASQAQRLKLRFRRVVRQDAETETVRLADLEEVDQSRPQEALQEAERLALHPSLHALRHEGPVRPGPLARELDLRLGEVVRRGSRSEVFLRV